MINHIRHALLLTGAALAAMSSPSRAQSPATGTIRGMIRGEDGRPVGNAEITVRSVTATHTTRSSGNGQFSITTEAGANTASVRLLGRQPVDTTLAVVAGATSQLDALLRRITSLDTVVTRALPAQCRDATSLEGFNCRRLNAPGIYLDQGDIARRKPYFLGDLFYEMPGMEVVPTKTGRSFRPKDYRTYCMVVLVDGRPGLSPRPEDLLGVEVFEKYQDVPAPYRNFSWMPRGEIPAGLSVCDREFLDARGEKTLAGSGQEPATR